MLLQRPLLHTLILIRVVEVMEKGCPPMLGRQGTMEGLPPMLNRQGTVNNMATINAASSAVASQQRMEVLLQKLIQKIDKLK